MTQLDRRTLLLGVGLGATVLGARAASAAPPAADWELRDAAALEVEGRGWSDVALPFDRLPARAEALVRPEVWALSRKSAGMCVHFRSDAGALRFECELTGEEVSMPHMPASGASGLDLYARDGRGAWRWVAATKPTARTYEVELSGLAPGAREYRLYLPLYNGVAALRIGVPAGASFESLPADARPPIVVYGTSIAQGACASRPGMAHVSVLGRRLAHPMVNLGFSGQGRLELEVVELLGELDAALYVLDCLPNLSPGVVEERALACVRRLRELRPDTPIALVEDRTNANAAWFPGRAQHHAGNHAALARAHARLHEEGVAGLTYVADAPFLGDDGEATVDGSHPSDLGMVRYADALSAALGPVLRR